MLKLINLLHHIIDSFPRLYQAKHYFSVLHRAGSNPTDINWFGSHTGIGIYCIVL